MHSLASVMLAVVCRNDPGVQSHFIVPLPEVRIEAPPLATRREPEAAAVAMGMLAHDRSIREIDIKFVESQPDVPRTKGVYYRFHIRIDERWRYKMLCDRRESHLDSVAPADRKTEPHELVDMQDHGEFVETMSLVTMEGGIRAPQSEIRTSITPMQLLGRHVEYNQFPRRLGRVLLESPTLELVAGPSSVGIVTLRSSLIIDGDSAVTIEVDVATDHGFAVVGIRRYSAVFNAIKRVTQTRELRLINGVWFPVSGFNQGFDAAPMSSKDEARFVDALTNAGFKEGMNVLDPANQERMRAGFKAYSGAPYLPMVPYGHGRYAMDTVGTPIINEPFSEQLLSIDRQSIKLWVNDLTGEVRHRGDRE